MITTIKEKVSQFTGRFEEGEEFTLREMMWMCLGTAVVLGVFLGLMKMVSGIVYSIFW